MLEKPGRKEEATVRVNRHRKNCTAGAVYTHRENEDTAASGYGARSIPRPWCCQGPDAAAGLRSPARTPSSPQMASCMSVSQCEVHLHRKEEIAWRTQACERLRGSRCEQQKAPQWPKQTTGRGALWRRRRSP